MEEIQQIFIAKPKAEENGSLSPHTHAHTKKPFHKKKKVNPTENAYIN